MRRLLALLVMLPAPLGAQPPRDRLDLNGRWELRLEDAGGDAGFTRSIQAPGAWQAQGFGPPAGVLRHQYEGAASYRRTVAVPPSWSGKTILLRIGGMHRRATLFVNGVEMGGHDGFSAPFDLDVSRSMRPGRDNEIVLRIENPHVTIEASPDKQEPVFPTGMLNYIGNWGGIYGDVALEAAPASRIDSVCVVPDVARRLVSFRIRARGAESGARATVRVALPGAPPVIAELAAAAGGIAEATLDVPAPNAPLWSPDDPKLLTAAIQLLRDGREIDRLEQRFGFRQVATDGHTLLLNGKPIYLRGYGDDNVEVLTGFPPSSRAAIAERLRLAKSFGFNAVRFHSMTPPPAYFDAADEVGLLVMAELPAAYTQYFFAHRDFLKRELESVLTAYRNHPSLLSLAFGNEFNLRWLKSDADRKTFLDAVAGFYRAAKDLAPATLILSNDGFDMRPTDMVSTSGNNPPADRPAVRHEFGAYYCSLPDISLIDRFTGVIEPEWLEEKKRWVAANAMERIYPEYVRNSQRLQQLGRKYQIERARADGRFTGYHYWLIVDYPGGTGEGDSWEEGWFDYFWRPKGVTPEQGLELNSPVLLMIDTDVADRAVRTGEPKRIGVLVSNYGPTAIRNGRLSWELRDGATRLTGADLDGIGAELGAVSRIGELALDPGSVAKPRKLELVLTLQSGHDSWRNRWSFWAWPRKPASGPAIPAVATGGLDDLAKTWTWIATDIDKLTPASLLITGKLDTAALAHLRAGGRVWLMPAPAPGGRGIPYFPASGGAYGTLVRSHPALGDFPHDGFCDLQFYRLVNGASPLSIDGWPAAIDPVIGAVRTTSEFLSKSKKLSRNAFIVEAKAGAGRLLVTTLKLRENLDAPEALSLLDSLLRYAGSDAFRPDISIPADVLERLAVP